MVSKICQPHLIHDEISESILCLRLFQGSVKMPINNINKHVNAYFDIGKYTSIHIEKLSDPSRFTNCESFSM